jgi:hypothetical protein
LIVARIPLILLNALCLLYYIYHILSAVFSTFNSFVLFSLLHLLQQITFIIHHYLPTKIILIFLFQAFGFCTFDYGISALRCKSILSEIDFNDPINALKAIISQQKITSKKALKTVLEILKNEAKALEVVRKEEELQKKYENGEMELTFSVDGNNGNTEEMKMEEKNEENSRSEKSEGQGEETDAVKEVEKTAEKEAEKEEEEVEEVEEVPLQYIPNPVLVPLYFEIKAGTKEQAVLDSLDEVSDASTFMKRDREIEIERCVNLCE